MTTSSQTTTVTSNAAPAANTTTITATVVSPLGETTTITFPVKWWSRLLGIACAMGAEVLATVIAHLLVRFVPGLGGALGVAVRIALPVATAPGAVAVHNLFVSRAQLKAAGLAVSEARAAAMKSEAAAAQAGAQLSAAEATFNANLEAAELRFATAIASTETRLAALEALKSVNGDRQQPGGEQPKDVTGAVEPTKRSKSAPKGKPEAKPEAETKPEAKPAAA